MSAAESHEGTIKRITRENNRHRDRVSNVTVMFRKIQRTTFGSRADEERWTEEEKRKRTNDLVRGVGFFRRPSKKGRQKEGM